MFLNIDLMDLIQIIAATLLVVALIFLTAKLYSRFTPDLSKRQDGKIKVLDSAYLGKQGKLLLIEAEGQISLLSMDNNSISEIWTKKKTKEVL